ncbi:MAG: DNA polymerase III subunit delta [Planctomycetes bacterium]|jgi:DNA polymerase-3 subunit delta|nr:DNA polymerase III subunit delta [Planctomycetota bacterium]
MPPRKKRSASRSAAKDVTLDASVRILALHGKEEMLKRQKLAELKTALIEKHGEIDTFTYDGKTATLADVFDELRGYSLMASYKLVIVDSADEFVKNHREVMERYAEQPVDHATLVLRAEAWNRGNLDKQIAKAGAIIKCDQLKPAEAGRWLVERVAAEHGTTITRGAAQLLVDRVGAKLGQLDAEAGKLALMAGPGQPIDESLVREVVGKGSDEQAWAVQEAILGAMQRGSGGAAAEALHEIIDLSGQPEVLVTYFVADLMRKLAAAEAMRAQGYSEGDIGKALKLWGPRQQMVNSVLRKLGPGKALRLLGGVLRADRRSKSGFGEARRNLECFTVAMADNL